MSYRHNFLVLNVKKKLCSVSCIFSVITLNISEDCVLCLLPCSWYLFYIFSKVVFVVCCLSMVFTLDMLARLCSVGIVFLVKIF